MAEFAIAALAVFLLVLAVGAYLYVSGPHTAYHCPTVTVGTGRC